MNKNAPAFYSGNYFLATSIISAGYLLLSYFLIGFKTDQLFVVVLFNTLFYATPLSRKFVTGFSIFIIYWVIFDYMKAFPNYRYNAIHIESLYNAEKHFFGIVHNGSTITPNEFLKLHTNNLLTVISGIFYLCWIPVPLAFATYLFFTNKPLFFKFSLTFLWVNLLGFVIYYVYPAAPPWYVALNGFSLIENTPGNPAGLAAFDAYFNMPVFKSLYAKSSNVFAAMPSLHSAYPLIVVYYSRKTILPLSVKLFLVLVAFGIWFGAVYTSHHYLLDVIAGIFTAVLGILLFNYMLRFKWLQTFENKMLLLTA
ncbi:MAG: phosphatase PAP2 family protein [Bacteroidota bacterium]